MLVRGYELIYEDEDPATPPPNVGVGHHHQSRGSRDQGVRGSGSKSTPACIRCNAQTRRSSVLAARKASPIRPVVLDLGAVSLRAKHLNYFDDEHSLSYMTGDFNGDGLDDVGYRLPEFGNFPAIGGPSAVSFATATRRTSCSSLGATWII